VNRTYRALIGLGLLASGCADPLPEITDVEGPRILAVTVRVVGDGERASPASGESVHVELVVADDGPRLPRTFAMVVCTPYATDLDVGRCETVLPGGTISGTSDATGPRFDIALPDAAFFGQATELLVHGAVCADGDLANDLSLENFPETFDHDNPCAAPQDVGEYVVFRIPLEGTSPNHVPVVDSLRLDGDPWTADAPVDAPRDGCIANGLPLVTADSLEHTIELQLSPMSREAYATDDGVQSFERPVAAFHATEGDFTGAYAFFTDDAPREIAYRARDDRDPSEIPADGRLARFTFVVRDGRGGTTAVTRALCLTP